MKKYPLLVCTSVAALAIAAGGALAQSDFAQSDRGASPGAAGRAAPPAEMAPPSGADAPGARMPAEGGSRLERSNPAAGPGMPAAERPEALDRTGPGEKSGDTAKSDKGGRDGSAASGASEGTSGRDSAKSADDKSLDKKSHDKTGARDKDAGDRSKPASEGASEGTAGAGEEGRSGSVTQLSGENRTKVQSAFRAHKSEAVVKDIDINVSVGVAVPRSVTLYAVPEEVVVIVPDYRRYKYFIYEDKVVIVDPVTFAIIDVLILA